METVITDLVTRYERGRLTRRQLIHGLSLLAATAAPASAAAAAAAQGPLLKSTRVDHLGVVVSNMTRSLDFYQKVMGLTVVGQDAANKIVRLGQQQTTLVSLREASPVGVDHYALAVEGFNEEGLTKRLAGQGISATRSTESGFHVKDPDGVNVQLV